MRNEIIIRKLLGYAQKILSYCDGLRYEEFADDSKLVEACVFNLSQMGELCRHVDRDYSQANPQIQWQELYGLRNRIVHDYEGVNLYLVWQIISEDLPETAHELMKLNEAQASAQ